MNETIVLVVILLLLILCYNYDNLHLIPGFDEKNSEPTPDVKLHHDTVKYMKELDSYNKNLDNIQNTEYDYKKYDSNKKNAINWIDKAIKNQHEKELKLETTSNYYSKVLNNNINSLNSHNIIVPNEDISVSCITK